MRAFEEKSFKDELMRSKTLLSYCRHSVISGKVADHARSFIGLHIEKAVVVWKVNIEREIFFLKNCSAYLSIRMNCNFSSDDSLSNLLSLNLEKMFCVTFGNKGIFFLEIGNEIVTGMHRKVK